MIQFNCFNIAAKDCPAGLVFTDCMDNCISTCSNIYTIQSGTCTKEECYPGCQCPQGTYLSNETCVKADECPCTYQGSNYAPGDTIQIDCNQW